MVVWANTQVKYETDIWQQYLLPNNFKKNLSDLGFVKGPIIQYIPVEVFSEMVLMLWTELLFHNDCVCSEALRLCCTLNILLLFSIKDQKMLQTKSTTAGILAKFTQKSSKLCCNTSTSHFTSCLEANQTHYNIASTLV